MIESFGYFYFDIIFFTKKKGRTIYYINKDKLNSDITESFFFFFLLFQLKICKLLKKKSIKPIKNY